jgi:hypothetical protein
VFWRSTERITVYWCRHAALLRHWRRQGGQLTCVAEFSLGASTPPQAAETFAHWLASLSPGRFALHLMVGASELRLGLVRRPEGARSAADWQAAACATLFPGDDTAQATDWRVALDPLPGGAQALCAGLRAADMHMLTAPFDATGVTTRQITPMCVAVVARHARSAQAQCAVAVSEPGAITSFATRGGSAFVAHLAADDADPLLRAEAIRAAVAAGIDLPALPEQGADPNLLAGYRLDLPAAPDPDSSAPPQPDSTDRFTRVF